MTRMSVASRCRPDFPAALMRRSTSLPDRYSRGRTSAFLGFLILFPRSAWERPCGTLCVRCQNSLSSRACVSIVTRSVAGFRSHAERGNEKIVISENDGHRHSGAWLGYCRIIGIAESNNLRFYQLAYMRTSFSTNSVIISRSRSSSLRGTTIGEVSPKAPAHLPISSP